MEQAEDGGVVPFGAAGVEDDLGVMAVEELSHDLAGAIDGSAGLLAVLVDRGGVAEVLHPIRAHSLHHLGKQRGGGIGVHIDSAHGRYLLRFDCKGNRKLTRTGRRRMEKSGVCAAGNGLRIGGMLELRGSSDPSLPGVNWGGFFTWI